MKILLIDVMSLDGKITKWYDAPAHTWASKEDSDYFFSTLRKNNLIVIGSNIFEQVKPTPEKGRLRVVMTRSPEKFKEHVVKGQLEFTSEKPQELVSRLEKAGYTQMLFVGGPALATQFLRKNLITEIWVTVEPRIFGKGRSFVTDTKLDISLKLFETTQLNSDGTVLMKYIVLQ